VEESWLVSEGQELVWDVEKRMLWGTLTGIYVLARGTCLIAKQDETSR